MVALLRPTLPLDRGQGEKPEVRAGHVTRPVPVIEGNVPAS